MLNLKNQKMKNKKFIFYIEITTACNLNCHFCPSSNDSTHQFMPLDQFKKLVDKIEKYVDLIYFHVLGEPTLHNHFLQILEYCEKKKLNFAITTNGILIHQYSNSLMKYHYLKKINISLQCLIQFNDVERENYIHNLNSFLLKREQEKSLVAINLRLWNNKDNVKTKNLNQNILEVYKEKAKTSKNIHISEADEFIWPSLDHSYNTNLTRCLGGKKQFAILNDGSLCLCCLDYKGSTKIGNLFIDDFSTLLQNSNYLEAISGFNKRKPYFELCKKCTYRNRFK